MPADWEWHLTAIARDVSIAGGFRAETVTLTISPTGFVADAHVRGLLGAATADFHGSIGYDGHFALVGKAAFDLGPIGASATFVLSYDGSVTKYTGYLSGSFGFTVGSGPSAIDVRGGLFGVVTITVGPGWTTHFSGSGSAWGTVVIPVFDDETISTSFTFDDHGFSIDLPVVDDIVVKW